ncbi:hypothetical protein ACYKOU_07410 [Streptococcus suis]|nr:hypothetical protein [Streptococcus suis]MCK3965881.1 hypothetical protein [Streptococcus suis]MCK3974439.1 hypothetical protein [Streptococcus suis]NQK32231.1 hypothetical protein [Streptococcus suis]NQK39369.1 hypothetical protein [Streptococcus suis]NQM11588.1 hypothetical protein [Streptococcus suis]
MLRDLFKPKEKSLPSSDRFKSLIHTLSAMTDTELEKRIEQFKQSKKES